MGSVTVSQAIDLPIPGMEVACIEASDGETYIARKLKIIQGAIIAHNLTNAQYTDEQASISFSGQTATIELLGTDKTDVKMTIVLFGLQ